jgi:hypothetical protein
MAWLCPIRNCCLTLRRPALLPYADPFFLLRIGTTPVSGGPRERTGAEWAALGLGLAATVIVTLYITYLATKTLQKQTDGRE